MAPYLAIISKVHKRWSPEEITNLHRYVGDGYSGGEIAKALNRPRNGVISKIHSLKIKSGRFNGEKQIAKKKVAKEHRFREKILPERLKHPAWKEKVQAKAKVKVEPVVVPVPPQMPPATAVTFAGLTDKLCHYPYGDPQRPDFCYCGAVLPDGGSYCAGHQQIMYQKELPGRRGASRHQR